MGFVGRVLQFWQHHDIDKNEHCEAKHSYWIMSARKHCHEKHEHMYGKFARNLACPI